MGDEENKSAGGSSEAAKGEKKAGGGGAFTNKMVKIMTVMAYMSGVSGAGVLLSLYYIIFWDPNIRGVRPPGYLRSGEMVGDPQALVAPMAQALKADPPAFQYRKMSREFMHAYFDNLTDKQGETQVAGDNNNMMESQVTPKVMPVMAENYPAPQQPYNGHTTSTQSLSNNNYQSSGSSPHQQGTRQETSPTGSPYASDNIRQQHQHGQPPSSTSA